MVHEDEADAQLVGRIAAGGARDAEGELCRRFAPRIRLYGLRHLHDEDRARDLVQAVLLAVLEAARAGRIEDPDRVDRFILGTCRNIASRTRAIDARATPADHATLDIHSFLPTMEAIDASALQRCMGTLDRRAHTVVYMSFQVECSADEIAAELKTTAGNVRVLRHRALAQLRRCLDERLEVAR